MLSSSDSDEVVDLWQLIATKDAREVAIHHSHDIDEQYRDAVIQIGHAVSRYFDTDSPDNYNPTGDCYDGINLGSEEVLEFADTIIMSGRDAYEKFLSDPFDGRIMSFLRRDISCGNSSCYYLENPAKPELTYQQLLKRHNIDSSQPLSSDIPFLNELFDIVFD